MIADSAVVLHSNQPAWGTSRACRRWEGFASCPSRCAARSSWPGRRRELRRQGVLCPDAPSTWQEWQDSSRTRGAVLQSPLRDCPKTPALRSNRRQRESAGNKGSRSKRQLPDEPGGIRRIGRGRCEPFSSRLGCSFVDGPRLSGAHDDVGLDLGRRIDGCIQTHMQGGIANREGESPLAGRLDRCIRVEHLRENMRSRAFNAVGHSEFAGLVLQRPLELR